MKAASIRICDMARRLSERLLCAMHACRDAFAGRACFLIPALLLGGISLPAGGLAQQTDVQSCETVMPDSRPGGMTVLVIEKGAYTKNRLKRAIYNENNRQLTLAYDTRGRPLFWCMGKDLHVPPIVGMPPRRVVTGYAASANTNNSGAPLTTRTLAKVILPDALKTYETYRKKISDNRKNGHGGNNINIAEVNQIDFRFILKESLQNEAYEEITSFNCQDKKIHAENANTLWDNLNNLPGGNGGRPALEQVNVYVDGRQLQRASLYALGIYLGMARPGSNAGFHVANNPACPNSTVKNLDLPWSSCKDIRGVVAKARCETSAHTHSPPSVPPAQKNPPAPQPPAPPAKKNPPAPQPPAPPAHKTASALQNPVREVFSLRINNHQPVPARITVKTLVGAMHAGVRISAANKASGNTTASSSVVTKGLSRPWKVSLVLTPDPAHCREGDVAVVDLRMEDAQGALVYFMRYIRRIRHQDCQQPVTEYVGEFGK